MWAVTDTCFWYQIFISYINSSSAPGRSKGYFENEIFNLALLIDTLKLDLTDNVLVTRPLSHMPDLWNMNVLYVCRPTLQTMTFYIWDFIGSAQTQNYPCSITHFINASFGCFYVTHQRNSYVIFLFQTTPVNTALGIANRDQLLECKWALCCRKHSC